MFRPSGIERLRNRASPIPSTSVGSARRAPRKPCFRATAGLRPAPARAPAWARGSRVARMLRSSSSSASGATEPSSFSAPPCSSISAVWAGAVSAVVPGLKADRQRGRQRKLSSARISQVRRDISFMSLSLVASRTTVPGVSAASVRAAVTGVTSRSIVQTSRKAARLGGFPACSMGISSSLGGADPAAEPGLQEDESAADG